MLSSAAIVWGVQRQSHMLPVALATTPSNTPTPPALHTSSQRSIITKGRRPANRNPVNCDDFLCKMKQYSDFWAQEGIVIAIYAIINTPQVEDADMHQVM